MFDKPHLRSYMVDMVTTIMYSTKAVTAYFTSKQLLPFGFVWQYICICILRGSTHYCAIALLMLSHNIVDFLGSRRMETAPTSIGVLLRPTLVQSDKPSDLRGSLSPTTRHRCTNGVCQAVTHLIMDRAGGA